MATKLVFYEVYEISYLGATECEKELALARIADILTKQWFVHIIR